MTDEEIQRAIGKACGRNGWWCPQCRCLVSEHSLGYQNRHANCTESAQQSPDYPNDLNAMHEAEKILTPEQKQDYYYALEDAICKKRPWKYDIILATSHQRAEAFLRAIGKWKDKA